MKEKVDYCSASILKNRYCNCCGWPIIFVCCNGSFIKFKDANKWDWWYYCSNKTCEHHDGEGIFQNRPDWVSIDKGER